LAAPPSIEPPRTLSKNEWPPDYKSVIAWKIQAINSMRENKGGLAGHRDYYRSRPVEWINHWGVTYDPRLSGTGKPTRMPFVMFKRQEEFVEALHQAVVEQVPLLTEKSRDVGATWLCCAFSIWLWLYWDGAAIGWGSRKKELVDKLGDPSSIFEKMRILLRFLPENFMPKGWNPDIHSTFMKIMNPETGAVITGEVGDNIGRGGRTLVYFKDESAHYEHPESVEASLGYNTRVQVDVSSVNGPATVFQRKRDAGKIWTPGSSMSRDATNVFIFDWSDHPEKTVDWYQRERALKRAEGLEHIFAQEVDRNPSAAVLGTLIEIDWVRAAVGAAERLGIKDGGNWVAGLDVADGDLPTGDRNGLIGRQGIRLRVAQEWGDRDPGVTTRRTIAEVEPFRPVVVQYDCVGVGAAVKAEYNRLVDDNLVSKAIRFVPWSAGSSPLYPERRMNERDPASPKNEDFFANLKAQGWWMLRQRFINTFRALTEANYTWDPDEIISIDPDLPLLQQLMKELTQPTFAKNTSMKIVVNKTPDGQRSPNLGDATMQCYWPADQGPMRISPEAVLRSRHGEGLGHRVIHAPVARRPMYVSKNTRQRTVVPAGASLNDY
jgi:hypothetical protein